MIAELMQQWAFALRVCAPFVHATEALEDTAADVAEWFELAAGGRLVFALIGAVDVAFDGLEAVTDGLTSLADLPRLARERAALLDSLPLRLAALEFASAARDMQGAMPEVSVALVQLRAQLQARRDDTRFADLDRRLAALEAATDRGAL